MPTTTYDVGETVILNSEKWSLTNELATIYAKNPLGASDSYICKVTNDGRLVAFFGAAAVESSIARAPED